MENEKLLAYLKRGGEQIWIGTKSPFDMETVELLNSSNYRVSSSHHHKYDTVWFCETLLDDVGPLGWKIVVDELIRLIGRQGILVIRMRDNGIPSQPLLKKFLGRHIGIEAELDYEHRDKETDIWILAFQIVRVDVEQYAAQDWTFAVLTVGKKVDNVVRFLKSIRDYEPNKNSEIIIVGPKNRKYDRYKVKYIDTAQFREKEYAEISKKKNAVIEMATKANLMIIHDRFVLEPNFFIGFEKWGYDFDFVTVSQFTEDGDAYPGYAATYEHMRFSRQIWVQEYRHLYDNQYINGGLIIMKRHIAKKILFNRMMMWAQMEDCELSQVCMEHGLIPRVNFISEAIVLEMSKGYLVSWDMESELAEKRTFSSRFQPVFYRFVQRITKHIPMRFKQMTLYRGLKKLYWRGKRS